MLANRGWPLNPLLIQNVQESRTLMPVFNPGFELAYEVYGDGPPVVAVHGFGSNGIVNWVATGWVETLTKRAIGS